MPDTYGPDCITAAVDESGLVFTLTSVEGNALAVTIPAPAEGGKITAAQMESVLVFLLGAMTNRTWIPAPMIRFDLLASVARPALGDAGAEKFTAYMDAMGRPAPDLVAQLGADAGAHGTCYWLNSDGVLHRIDPQDVVVR